MRKSHCLRIIPTMLLAGCSTFMTAEDAQPIIAPKLVGRHAFELIAMYGQPVLTEVQEGHDVYYWQRLTGYAYTPQYSATTQGTIGYGAGVPFSSTTTMAGETQVGATPCVLVAGTYVGSDVIKRVQLRGAACEAFLPHK